MNTKPRKKMWKVVEIPYWQKNHKPKRAPCAYLSPNMQNEFKIIRYYARYLTPCRAKRLVKELEAFDKRTRPHLQDHYRWGYEARPMGG